MEVKRDANFIGALLLHQHRRDVALGLTHITARQRGLLWYYNTLQKEAHEAYLSLMMKSFHLGMVRGIRKRMRRIIKDIKASPQNAQRLYSEYKLLQVQFDKSIEVLTNG